MLFSRLFLFVRKALMDFKRPAFFSSACQSRNRFSNCIVQVYYVIYTLIPLIPRRRRSIL